MAFHFHPNLLFHAPMEKSILITGGARSGKSQLAEKLALRPTGKAIYIATSEIHDDEMAQRIDAHRARRGPEWHDFHAPIDLSAALKETDGSDPRLVDCLTLWLTNLILSDLDWDAAAQDLIDTLSAQSAPVVFVTNEVGAGIVPENELARRFRDAAGLLNQRIASNVDTVYFCVSGYPIKVKPNDFCF